MCIFHKKEEPCRIAFSSSCNSNRLLTTSELSTPALVTVPRTKLLTFCLVGVSTQGLYTHMMV